jgi:hypothetical protein
VISPIALSDDAAGVIVMNSDARRPSAPDMTMRPPSSAVAMEDPPIKNDERCRKREPNLLRTAGPGRRDIWRFPAKQQFVSFFRFCT